MKRDGWASAWPLVNQVASGNMNPIMVGVSLFATLLSTITYLSMPGEAAGKGPVVMVSMLALPLVYLVVAYFLLPVYMQQRVTSAYELLEARLGLSIRLLGATLFLTLRLVWMTLLIYLAARAMVVMIFVSGKCSAAHWTFCGAAQLPSGRPVRMVGSRCFTASNNSIASGISGRVA